MRHSLLPRAQKSRFRHSLYRYLKLEAVVPVVAISAGRTLILDQSMLDKELLDIVKVRRVRYKQHMKCYTLLFPRDRDDYGVQTCR